MRKSYTSQADNELIMEFQAGNDCAFSVIVERYQKGIYGVLIKMTKDPDLTKDLMQETFLKAFKRFKNPNKAHDNSGNLRNWLSRIAKNTCVDHFRKVSRVPFMVQMEELTDSDDPAKEQYQKSAEESQIENDWQQFIRKCVKELPDEQKELILLRVYNCMSYKEIATLTDVSINTALGRMRYALKNLKRDFEAAEFKILHVA